MKSEISFVSLTMPVLIEILLHEILQQLLAYVNVRPVDSAQHYCYWFIDGSSVLWLCADA